MRTTPEIQLKATLALLVALGGSAATANVLVVRSAGPSSATYPPGLSLPDDASVRLTASDRLTVLGPGGTRTFTGPGAFRVAGPLQTGDFARHVPRSRSRIGAVRGDGTPDSPGLWDVDVSRGGLTCLAPAGSAILWRRGREAAAAMTISAPGAETSRLEWPAGRATLAWPRSLPIAEGAEYRLLGNDRSVSVRFRRIAAMPPDSQALATLFIREGCNDQLERLLAASPAAD